MVTAYDQPALREKCLADGAAAYFAKPLRREELIAAIDAAIGRQIRRRLNRRWRLGAESNRCTRLCRPLHDHSAT